MDYQAVILTPFAGLGIRCSEEYVQAIEFLPRTVSEVRPSHRLAQEVCKQIADYLAEADFRFDLPFELKGSAHQIKVWQEIRNIPRGSVRSYGEIAATLHSSPRAVGQACGHNPLPIVIPCHRVVSRSGLGGFMHRADVDALEIKRWLLAHER